jgi:hypothetical protein
MPEVFPAGFPAMNRASILASLPAQGAVTDEQFALASWAVVSQRFSHFCYAGNAASGEVYDPLRLLRGYGFACCEQVARVLAWLWEGAGYEARLASMKNFHTVPEIYYQGAWHMYDPDHKVYYLARDNQTVADVAMAKADPYLVARTADANGNDPVGYSAQWMADQYAAAEISYWTPHYTTDTQYTLRPSESFTLSSENLFSEVLYARLTNSLGRQAPRAVTSGQYDWALDFSQPQLEPGRQFQQRSDHPGQRVEGFSHQRRKRTGIRRLQHVERISSFPPAGERALLPCRQQGQHQGLFFCRRFSMVESIPRNFRSQDYHPDLGRSQQRGTRRRFLFRED